MGTNDRHARKSSTSGRRVAMAMVAITAMFVPLLMPSTAGAVTTPTVSLTPTTSVNNLGGTQDLTATVTDAGAPVAGQPVVFTVNSGPDKGQTKTVATTATGQAATAITDSTAPGVDTVTAAVTDASGTQTSGPAIITWQASTQTGRAIALTTAGSALLSTSFEDTGPVSTQTSAHVAKSAVVASSRLVSASVLGAAVAATPGTVASTASVANLTVGGTLLPVIRVVAASATAGANCDGVSGSTTISSVTVAGISVKVGATPNTTVSLLGVTLVFNQQVQTGNSLTVNALHLTVGGLLNVVVASAQAGVHCASVMVAKTINCAATSVTPQLSLTLAADQSTAIPGSAIDYNATLTNTGDVLHLAGDFFLKSRSDINSSVLAYWDQVEYWSEIQKAWAPIAGFAAGAPGYTPVVAPPMTSGLTLTSASVPESGATYPSSGDPIVGTQLNPGSTGAWTYAGSVALSPTVVSLLMSATQAGRLRNVLHVEMTPRDTVSGQPFYSKAIFTNPFQPTKDSETSGADTDQYVACSTKGNTAADTGAATNAAITVNLPTGTATFNPSTTPALASILPGASVSVTAKYTVPVPAPKGATETDAAYIARLTALDGASLRASATAAATSSAGPLTANAPPVSTTEQLPILTISKSGPTAAEAGTTVAYAIALADTGQATASPLDVTDTLPDGTALTVTGTPASLAPSATASASASYAIPALQPAGPLADTAAVTWKDANGNAYGPITSVFTTQISSSLAGSTLTLAPPTAGPDVTGTSQTLTLTYTTAGGSPAANQAVTLTIGGANPQTTVLTTDGTGTATFTYQGTNSGTDTAQASVTSGSFTLQSNTSTISWVTPVVSVSTTSIHGQFYAGGCGYFCANVNQPLWSQDFPTIDFNPPGGTVPGNNTGVGVNTRPFTDITTDPSGNYNGFSIAQGNGYQAGVGSLGGFDATFTGTFVVAQAGNQTFNFYDDDGFDFGAGGGATRVGGDDVNPPAATALEGYPIMGAFNDPTSPSGHQVTVNFPAPGTYPYEVDYSECCGGQLALTMASAATGIGIPPAGNITLSPQENIPTQAVGQPFSLTVSATDASGQPLASLPVLVTVGGNDSDQQTVITNSQGVATFTYTGAGAGTDFVEANATVSGSPQVSNVVTVNWAYGSGSSPAQPPVAISGTSPASGSLVTAPTPISATFTAPAGQTIASWTVTYQGSAAGATPVTLASGTGTPPDPLATFDPTNLPNDTYTITLSATASGGGTQAVTTSVAVNGNLKLGHDTSAFQDLNVPVGGFQMQVLRTYDSLNAATSGDFGDGWNLSLTNFRVSTNGPLGAGGWSEVPTSCVLGLCSYAYKSADPHFVTVTWPDGHQEVFDFTPQGGQAVFYFQGTTAFTARPGTDTTSRLQVDGDQTADNQFDGNLYNGSSGIINPTRFDLTTKNGTKLVLDVNTGLVSETDPNGNTLTVTSGGVTSSTGQSLTFTRDSSGRITQIIGPAGQQFNYTFDGAGNLASSIDPNGNATTYTYDANHGLLKAVGPGSHPLQTLTYDSSERITSITDANGHTTMVSDNVAGRQQTVADPNGLLTSVYTYDSRGDVVAEQRVASGHTLTDSYSYDANGNLIGHTDPAGDTTAATYDPSGDITNYTDAGGHTTNYTYNALGEMTSETGPGGQALSAATYDANGNLTQLALPTGATQTYTYNGAGNVTARTNADGQTQTYGYNAAGNLDTVTDASGHTTTLTTDADGNTTSITDASGNNTTFAYDPDGNLLSITDANGHAKSFTYNSLEQLATETDSDGHTTTLTYDPVGNLSNVVNRDGQTITYAYNVDGQLTAMTQPTGTTTYTYDAFGHLSGLTNPDGTLSYSYDGAGRVLSQTSGGTATSLQPTVTLSYTYDAAGNRLSLVDPAGTTTYAYNPLSELTGITSPAGSFAFSYNAVAALTSITRPNGADDTLTYDPAGNLTSRVATDGPTTVAEAEYAYTPAGLRSSLTDLTGTSTYSYSPTNQLVGATHPAGGPSAESYTYDPAGNRTSSASEAIGSFTYDPGDRLTSDAHYNYSYDNEGNLLTRTLKAGGGTTAYTWNAEHQLTAIHLPNGTTTTYRYDPLGRRIEVDANGQITRYVYDGANIVAEYNGSNVLQATYTNGLGADSPLSMSRAGQNYYYLQDGQNSVTALTNSAGAVVDRYTYDAYGNQTATGSVTNPFTYSGMQYDPSTGLYFDQARYYNPANGQFISEDPTSSVNPYPYGNDSPTNFTDPTGAEDEVESAVLAVYNDDLSRAQALQKLVACVAGQLLFAVLAMGGQTVTPPNEGDLVTGAFANWFVSFLPDQLQTAYGLLQSAASGGLDGLKATAGQDISDKTIEKMVGQLYDAAGLPDGTQDFVNGLKDGYDLDQDVAKAAQAAADGSPDAAKEICDLCTAG